MSNSLGQSYGCASSTPPAAIPAWNGCTSGSTCVNGYTCCVGPADVGNGKLTCRVANAFGQTYGCQGSTPSGTSDCDIVRQAFPSLNIPAGCAFYNSYDGTNAISMYNGNVVGINFDGLGLSGPLPSSLSLLGGHLQSLALRHNNIQGPIPASWVLDGLTIGCICERATV